MVDEASEDPFGDEGACSGCPLHDLRLRNCGCERSDASARRRDDPPGPSPLSAGVRPACGPSDVPDTVPPPRVHRGRLPGGLDVLPDDLCHLQEAGSAARLPDRCLPGDVRPWHGGHLWLLLRLLPAEWLLEPHESGFGGWREDPDERPHEDCGRRHEPFLLHARPVLPPEGDARGHHPAFDVVLGGLQDGTRAVESLEAGQVGRHEARLCGVVDLFLPDHLHGGALRHRQRSSLLVAHDCQGCSDAALRDAGAD
mmetsp:Transcript_99730/g.251596  ORF Transcript_99730/g.251596 Transcript_99730/m.251596 type:complete len:255 (-) Transcript_99730:869-1633(-)